MEHNDSSGIREEEFRYDACGNLFDSKPCPASQTEEYRNTQYRYDEFGRLSRKWNHSLEQRFEYDADSRLVKVENVRGTLYTQVEMEYDLLGRRTLKRAHHRWTNAVEETRFSWTGLRLYGEKQPDCPEVLFTYEEGSYAPLARVVGRGESTGVQWFRNGLNGNPEALTDGNGVLKWRQREPVLWGKTQYEDLTDAQGVMQNLRFQGQYLDRETGLHYNLFRYYDPECGRFTQQDPIGLAGGVNLYQYAPNPLGWIDPLGLPCKLTNQQFKNKLKRIRNQTAAGGNRGITGVVSQNDAFRLGEAFVGPNYRVMSSGKGLVSEDGLRTFRFPADKRGFDRVNGRPWSKTGKQVNFETKNGDGDVIANVHLDVENFRP
ncbi:TPA: hypothetical protein R5R88_003784 [Salmonella enterica]|nr:hypothetical protein [Salmonella enterica]